MCTDVNFLKSHFAVAVAPPVRRLSTGTASTAPEAAARVIVCDPGMHERTELCGGSPYCPFLSAQHNGGQFLSIENSRPVLRSGPYPASTMSRKFQLLQVMELFYVKVFRYLFIGNFCHGVKYFVPHGVETLHVVIPQLDSR